MTLYPHAIQIVLHRSAGHTNGYLATPEARTSTVISTSETHSGIRSPAKAPNG